MRGRSRPSGGPRRGPEGHRKSEIQNQPLSLGMQSLDSPDGLNSKPAAFCGAWQWPTSYLPTGLWRSLPRSPWCPWGPLGSTLDPLGP